MKGYRSHYSGNYKTGWQYPRSLIKQDKDSHPHQLTKVGIYIRLLAKFITHTEPVETET